MHDVEGEFRMKLFKGYRLPPDCNGRKGRAGFKPDGNRLLRQQACHPASTDCGNGDLAIRANQFRKKIAQHRFGARKVLALWMDDKDTHSRSVGWSR